MTPTHVVDAASVAPQPWRNGGGTTRELLAWPSAQDWIVRISVAEIASNGPFSAFPDVERGFAVIDGAGVVLELPQGHRRLDTLSRAVRFAGEAAPMCRLIDGPTRDLNFMARRNAGRIRMHRDPLPDAAWRWRGLFSDDALWWTDDAALPWPAAAQGWWLGLEAP
jgi:environmental stress-induced protein Ves